MSKRPLPQLRAYEGREGVDFEVTPSALQRWNPAIRAAKDDKAGTGTISVYGYIGETWDGEGVTAKRIAGALRAIGENDVVVNINSPGGSAFEGVAIYNLLRQHPKNVTVQVVGLAASAASIIAMAGDEIRMGRGAQMMIHNVLMLAIGNRNDLRAAADVMEPIDRELANLYAARTGKDADEVGALMDAETWMGPDAAIENAFADGMMDDGEVAEDKDDKRSAARARAELQAVLAKSGYSRGQQRDLLKAFTNAMPGAGANNGDTIMPGADGQPLNQPKDEGTKMDLLKLKAEHPELVTALIAEGHAAGVTAGAEAERQRIKDVEAQAMPGHDALIAALKFDGKTTGPEAAVQVLNAERGTRDAKAAAQRKDAAALAGVPAAGADAAAEAAAAAAVQAAKTPKERWDADPKLRAEYGDNFEAFTAFEKAQASGKVRILTGKQAA